MINTSYRLEEILSKQRTYGKNSKLLSLGTYIANKHIFKGQKIDLRPYTVSLLPFFIAASSPQRKPCRWWCINTRNYLKTGVLEGPKRRHSASSSVHKYGGSHFFFFLFWRQSVSISHHYLHRSSQKCPLSFLISSLKKVTALQLQTRRGWELCWARLAQRREEGILST